MDYMFNNCTSLTSLNLVNFTGKEMRLSVGMFKDYQNLVYIDLSNFDANPLQIGSMFLICYSLEYLKTP